MGDNEQWPLKWGAPQPGHTQCHCPRPLISYPLLGQWQRGSCHPQPRDVEEGQGHSIPFCLLHPHTPGSPAEMKVSLKKSLRHDKDFSMFPVGDKVECPSGEKHSSAMSSSCPHTQTIEEPPPLMGAISGNKGMCLEENVIHRLQTTEPNGVTQEAAATRTGLSKGDLDSIQPWGRI